MNIQIKSLVIGIVLATAIIITAISVYLTYKTYTQTVQNTQAISGIVSFINQQISASKKTP